MYVSYALTSLYIKPDDKDSIMYRCLREIKSKYKSIEYVSLRHPALYHFLDYYEHLNTTHSVVYLHGCLRDNFDITDTIMFGEYLEYVNYTLTSNRFNYANACRKCGKWASINQLSPFLCHSALYEHLNTIIQSCI